MIWFTADTHYGHENIIDYCHRPWNRVGKMDQAIVHRYQKVVKPEDTIYFVGDFSIKGPMHKGYIHHMINQLVGTKILILGNHDKLDPFMYEEIGFQTVHTALQLPIPIGGYPYINLRHDPVAAITDTTALWLCGHVHTLFKTIRNIINVGVDQWEFFPVSLEEISVFINGGTNERT